MPQMMTNNDRRRDDDQRGDDYAPRSMRARADALQSAARRARVGALASAREGAPAPVWIEVQEGDMQRQAENAYMYRRSFTRDFAILCTHPGYAEPLDDDTIYECYARDIGNVEWYCPEMSHADFDALTQEDVGVNAEAATEPPVNVDVPAVMQDGDELNCTMGNWENEPTSYSYQWKIDGEDVGSNAPSYTSTAGDVGHIATCTVTATNAAGSTTAPPSDDLTVA